MKTIHNPVAAPPTYSEGMEVTPGVRTLYIAGQVGWDEHKNVPGGIEAQTELLFQNMQHVLESAGMTFADIVKMNTYLVEPDDLAGYGAVRARMLQGVKPAATLVYIKQLIRPELLVEVDAVAVAKA